MLEKWKRYSKQCKQRIRLYQLLARHPRTPRAAKWLLAAAIGYILLPFDVIPDWIPILGVLDDLLIVPLLIWGAWRLIPSDVIKECTRDVPSETG